MHRWRPEVFENSSIDWSTFDLERPDHLPQRATKSLRDYQQTALDDVRKGFTQHDRGKLIMACGSGKTFTALRIAEATAGVGGKVVIFNADQEQVGIDLDTLLSDDRSGLNMDNGVRIVGCWNGLGKRGAAGIDFTDDPLPVKRAVAFSNTIMQSKLFTESFPAVINACIAATEDNAVDGVGNHLRAKVEHVDGSQNAMQRAEYLAWLRQEPEAGACQILSNARCLTGGIDVPALDAVLFLHPRKSDIDVV